MGEDTLVGTEPSWLVRVVEWFERDPGNELVGEAELDGVSLDELQRLWQTPADDPMLGCYPVGEPQRAAVELWAGAQLDLIMFDYFISAYTRDWTATQRAGGYIGQFPPPESLPAFPDARRVKPR